MLKTSLSQSVLVRQTSARIGQCRTDRKGSLSLSKISSSNSNYCNRNTTLKDQISSSKASVGRRKHSVAAMNFFGGLFGGEKKRQGKNDDVLRWARCAQVGTKVAPPPPDGQELATFAGGCFWGIELAYQRVPGVTKTYVGYTQGTKESPSYEEVCSGRTGHTEAVEMYFNPSEVSYKKLLDVFFERTDPTTLNRQGNDAGTQYRSGIYYHNDKQRQEAEEVMTDIQKQIDAGTYPRRTAGKKVVVELKEAGPFWMAEDYHQQYLERGGRFGSPQSAEKGDTTPIRCYG